MSKDIGVVIALPAELKHRIEARAAHAGLSIHTLMLAWVIQGMTGTPGAASPPPFSQNEMAELIKRVEARVAAHKARVSAEDVAEMYGDDAWPEEASGGSLDEETSSDVDVDAMIANRLNEAESAGLAEPPGQAYEAFGPPTSQVAPANVRALRRPPRQFAPANGPRHLQSL